MRDLKDLKNYYLSNSDKELMLCTIVKKSGSGYRGIGAKKIIQKDGNASGYLSGGCLEGDIIRTATEKWNEAPFIQSFSTMSDEDRLMGYQTGCAGIIEILFEHLPKDASCINEYLPYGIPQDIKAVGVSIAHDTMGQRHVYPNVPHSSDSLFIDPWVAPLEVFVIGCGANARPFAELAPPLGWNVTFIDYRQSYNVPETDDVRSIVLPLKEIGNSVSEGPRSAVIVMTHNYEADLDIVGQLNKKKFGYIGCVGPRKRFDQILHDLKTLKGIVLDEDWVKGVHAPAGLKQGRSPEDIAFSIIAEIQFGLTE